MNDDRSLDAAWTSASSHDYDQQFGNKVDSLGPFPSLNMSSEDEESPAKKAKTSHKVGKRRSKVPIEWAEACASDDFECPEGKVTAVFDSPRCPDSHAAGC